jgi:hypothetical protein
MAKITISTSNQAGDIPTYEFTKKELLNKFFTTIQEQLELSEDKVFVAFPSFELNFEDYKQMLDDQNNHTINSYFKLLNPSFFVSSNIDDILFFYYDYISRQDCETINFNFFCFKTFTEAFNYCIDLKDGTE